LYLRQYCSITKILQWRHIKVPGRRLFCHKMSLEWKTLASFCILLREWVSHVISIAYPKVIIVWLPRLQVMFDYTPLPEPRGITYQSRDLSCSTAVHRNSNAWSKKSSLSCGSCRLLRTVNHIAYSLEWMLDARDTSRNRTYGRLVSIDIFRVTMTSSTVWVLYLLMYSVSLSLSVVVDGAVACVNVFLSVVEAD